MQAAALACPIDCEPLLQRFAPLVTRLARQLVAKLPSCVELDDIVQAGMIGLMDAARRFKEGQGAQFETFATQRVRGAMLDELRQNDWAPRTVRRTQRALDNALHALEQRLGRAPCEREVAAELGLELAEYREMLVEARSGQVISYDESEENDEGEVVARHSADASDEPPSRYEDRRLREALVAAIERLPERERQLMGLYYEQDLNFREIAAVLGVTESRICQMHTQAVARLRAGVNG
jgi:RNA polymerase sigma factor for flagellar operon FliA